MTALRSALTGRRGRAYNPLGNDLFMGSDHYFSAAPQSSSERREIRVRLRGVEWRFITDHGVFSYGRLDPGTRLLAETIAIESGARVLDVGAGYGPVGLVAARLAGPEGMATLFEVNARAAELSRENAALNGVANVTVIEGDDLAAIALPPQDHVVTNPPVRAGWKVVVPLLTAAADKLKPGGKLWLVGSKHLGVNTLGKHLAELVGPPEVAERQGGFRVLVATRESGDG